MQARLPPIYGERVERSYTEATPNLQRSYPVRLAGAARPYMGVPVPLIDHYVQDVALQDGEHPVTRRHRVFYLKNRLKRCARPARACIQADTRHIRTITSKRPGVTHFPVC
jgi:hypothetical protein